MTNLIVTSDDLSPQTLHLFEKYWKPLKDKHPKLKVTFFVSPNNMEFGQENNHISKVKEFKEWFENNKSWVEVQPHGLTHEKPPENLRGGLEQQDIIEKSLVCLIDYLPKNWVYKAPFYRMNKATIELLSRMDFKGYCQWWSLTLLIPNKKQIPYYLDMGTHSSDERANCPDNIDKCLENLDKNLTQLENASYNYKTYSEFIEELI